MAKKGTPHGIVTFDAFMLVPTLESVDLLARLMLAARRRGGRVELCGVSLELRALVVACGLGEVLRAAERTEDQCTDAPKES